MVRTFFSSMPRTAASMRIVRLRSLVRSRSIEMLNEWRFSTSTRPSRSNTSPRGARSASVRWWLFSAISSYFACCRTCSVQKLTASTQNSAPMMNCRPFSRRLALRRSSTMGISYILKAILTCWNPAISGISPSKPAFAHSPALYRPWEQLHQLKGRNAHDGVCEGLTGDCGVRDAKRPLAQHGRQPNRDRLMRDGCDKEHQEPRQGLGHDELRADDAGHVADDRLGQATDADKAGGERILNQPGNGSRQQPGH